MNIMILSSERTKCNGKVGMKCWESEGSGIATRKVKSEWITKWTLSWRGKCQVLTTVGVDMLVEKGSRRESKKVMQWYRAIPTYIGGNLGNGGYGKAYNKIVRGSD